MMMGFAGQIIEEDSMESRAKPRRATGYRSIYRSGDLVGTSTGQVGRGIGKDDEIVSGDADT